MCNLRTVRPFVNSSLRWLFFVLLGALFLLTNLSHNCFGLKVLAVKYLIKPGKIGL